MKKYVIFFYLIFFSPCVFAQFKFINIVPALPPMTVWCTFHVELKMSSVGEATLSPCTLALGLTPSNEIHLQIEVPNQVMTDANLLEGLESLLSKDELALFLRLDVQELLLRTGLLQVLFFMRLSDRETVDFDKGRGFTAIILSAHRDLFSPVFVTSLLDKEITSKKINVILMFIKIVTHYRESNKDNAYFVKYCNNFITLLNKLIPLNAMNVYSSLGSPMSYDQDSMLSRIIMGSGL